MMEKFRYRGKRPMEDVCQITAKVGRNPKTGEVVPIPETKHPAFRAGKVLKNAVKKNGPKERGPEK